MPHSEEFMARKGIVELISSAALAYALTAVSLVAQCPTSVVAGGLQAPTKVITTSGANLLIAEAGFGSNVGRISVLNPDTGQIRTFIDGLPSGFSPPENDPTGPAGLACREIRSS
jgi:hypothetical protein